MKTNKNQHIYYCLIQEKRGSFVFMEFSINNKAITLSEFFEFSVDFPIISTAIPPDSVPRLKTHKLVFRRGEANRDQFEIRPKLAILDIATTAKCKN